MAEVLPPEYEEMHMQRAEDEDDTRTRRTCMKMQEIAITVAIVHSDSPAMVEFDRSMVLRDRKAASHES